MLAACHSTGLTQPPCKGLSLPVHVPEREQAVVVPFYPAFREVRKMLFQNVLPKLEASADYQEVLAQHQVIAAAT